MHALFNILSVNYDFNDMSRFFKKKGQCYYPNGLLLTQIIHAL